VANMDANSHTLIRFISLASRKTVLRTSCCALSEIATCHFRKRHLEFLQIIYRSCSKFKLKNNSSLKPKGRPTLLISRRDWNGAHSDGAQCGSIKSNVPGPARAYPDMAFTCQWRHRVQSESGTMITVCIIAIADPAGSSTKVPPPPTGLGIQARVRRTA
jgi:hypothetical protein